MLISKESKGGEASTGCVLPRLEVVHIISTSPLARMHLVALVQLQGRLRKVNSPNELEEKVRLPETS